MNLTEFFGLVVKPRLVRGKGLWAPLSTGQVSKNLYAIRDKDVNIFLFKTPKGYIAIDSAYKNSQNALKGLAELKISAEAVHSLLITHLDLDHAGGIDQRCQQIFPHAKIYLSAEEEKYLNQTYFRKKILGIGLASPIQLGSDYLTFDQEATLTIDGLEVLTIFAPGHTLGHTAYLLDQNLFVGDSLVLGEAGGYCFYDFWNADTKLNMTSLDKLYAIAKKQQVKRVITSHTGYTEDIDWAFSHRHSTVNWRQKGFVFRKDAPYDVYKD